MPIFMVIARSTAEISGGGLIQPPPRPQNSQKKPGLVRVKVIKCRGESFARCRVIARNVEGGGPFRPPQSF